MVFDMAARELVAATSPNTLLTIDLDTGDVLASIDLPTAAAVLEVGLSPDGLVVVVASNEVVVVDRRSGVPVSRRELRDVLSAWYRPDGRSFTVSAGEQRVGVIDLEGNALIRQTHSIDPLARTIFNAGLVAAFGSATGSTVEVIDLSSGERSVTELVTPDGERFTPRWVHPDRSGLWAVGLGVFTRWEDGLLVERFELAGTSNAIVRIGDRYGYGYTDSDGVLMAALIDVGSGSAEVLFSVPTENFDAPIPTPEGGLFVLDGTGSLVRYDADGVLLDRVQTRAERTSRIAVDPLSGTIAAATSQGVVSIIDPTTGDTDVLPTLEPVSNIGFGRDGELLAVTGSDGTVRLWDLERNVSAGVVWTGTASALGASPWFDADSNSLWVASSGKVLNIPLDPAQWVQQACEVVGRDLTQDEWDRYVSGDKTRQSACGREITG
ncbi:MAG: WD40 repeat protein [Acidimicrobiales bacterium]|jgi:WD40 repeat protein